MPPKKSVPPSSPTPSISQSDLDLINRIEELSNTITSFSARFDKLESLLEATTKENSILKDTLKSREEELSRLRVKLNDVEQYQRSWSIRVLNVPISEADSKDPSKVMETLYSKVLLPILKGARERNLLHSIPPAEQLLETAHILPAKPNSIPPIIARFYTRNLRSLIFKLKKEFAPRLAPDQQPVQPNRASRQPTGRLAFPIHEDLTRANFGMLKTLSHHKEVAAAWSVKGIIHYKLNSDPAVKKVKSVFEPISSFLS